MTSAYYQQHNTNALDMQVFDDASWPLAPGAWDFNPCEDTERKPTAVPPPAPLASEWYATSPSAVSSVSGLSPTASSSSSSFVSEYDMLLRAPKLPTRPLLSSSPVPCHSYAPHSYESDLGTSVDGTRPPFSSRYSALGLQFSPHLPSPPVSPVAKKRRLEEPETLSTEERQRSLRRAQGSPSDARPTTAGDKTHERRPMLFRALSEPTTSSNDMDQLAPWCQRVGRARGRNVDLPKQPMLPAAPASFALSGNTIASSS